MDSEKQLSATIEKKELELIKLKREHTKIIDVIKFNRAKHQLQKEIDIIDKILANEKQWTYADYVGYFDSNFVLRN